MRLEATPLKPSLCPYCGYCGDAATQLHRQDKGPRPGDWAMCIACGGMTVFEKGLTMRKLRDDEWDEAEPELQTEIGRMKRAQKTIAHKIKRNVPNA